MLNKSNQNLDEPDGTPSATDGDGLAARVAQLAETVDFAVRTVSALTDALIAKGLLTQADLDQAAERTQRLVSEVHSLLDQLHVEQEEDRKTSNGGAEHL